MEITEHEIVNVITIILSRLDELEDEQKISKDFILELKDRLIDLNACVDDILDIISDSDDLLFAEKLKRYSKMKSMFLELNDIILFLEEIKYLLLQAEDEKELELITQVIEMILDFQIELETEL